MALLRPFRRLLLLLLLLAGLPAAAQQVEWVQSLLIDPLDTTYRGYKQVTSTTAPDGSTYIYGGFNDSVVTAAGTLRPHTPGINARGDYFLTKYDAAGRAQWLKRIGGPNRDYDFWAPFFALGAASSKHFYLASVSGAQTDFGQGTVMDSAGSFIARYRADGSLQWLHQFTIVTDSIAPTNSGSEMIQPAGSISTDSAGNAYMAFAYFMGDNYTDTLRSIDQIPVGYSPRAPMMGGDFPGAILKIDSLGVVQWVATVTGSAGSDFMGIYSITGDGAGNTYIAGQATGHYGIRVSTRTQGPGTPYQLPSTGFLAKLDPNGAVSWVLADTAAFNEAYFFNASPDHLGNVYLRSVGACSVLGNMPVTTDNFIAKITAAGQPLWLRPAEAQDYNVSPRGRLFAGDYYSGNWIAPTVGGIALPPIQPGQRRDFMVALDSANHGLWLQYANLCSSGLERGSVGPFYLRPKKFGFDAQDNIYSLQLNGSRGPGQLVGYPTLGTGAALVKVRNQPSFGQVQGTVYLDQNANGARDAGEPPFPRQLAVGESVHGRWSATNTLTGRYELFTDTGAYALSLVAPAHYQLTQGAAGHTGQLVSVGQLDTARHFGIAPIAGATDVRVTLTPTSRARRGAANHYRLRLENLGTTTASGQLTVQLDPATPYLGAIPSPTQQSGSTATWAFQNLAPFAISDVDLAYTIPLNVALGTHIRSSAVCAVPGDVTPSNDVDSVQQEVVGSYDPNDLLVNYSILTPDQVAAGATLDYTIRFQNTGNDTAFAVLLHDTLPANLLRLGTLQLVSSSHNCWWNLLDANRLEVHFDNIRLPHQGANVLGSMGFARFQVAPSAQLVPGVQIPNTAHITFDYNAPLATNQVFTLVQAANGLVAAIEQAPLSLYPNPATSSTCLTLGAEVVAPGHVQVLITDLLGRAIRQESIAALAGPWQHSLSAVDLPPGVYAVRLTLPDGRTASRRLVVR